MTKATETNVKAQWGNNTHKLQADNDNYCYDGNNFGGRLYKIVPLSVKGNGLQLMLVLGRGGSIQFYHDDLPIELLQTIRKQFHN